MPTASQHLPHGTQVRYQGSLTAQHGAYIYDGPCMCDDDDWSEGCEDEGNRHQLAYDEPNRVDGTRRVLLHVHRDSFTIV